MSMKPKELTLRSLILGALITTIFTAAACRMTHRSGSYPITLRLAPG